MAWGTIAEISKQVRSGETSAMSLVEDCLRRIESANEYKAIISVVKNRALERASFIDEQIRAGKNPGRLCGVPFIAKDNYLSFGAETTAASNILKNFEAPYQSTVIEKLEAEGAICVAKANLDAFAHGSSTENSDFFTTLNPHDKSRVPGGSSGGSAAAVVLGLAPFALGSDTGGSIRLPASFTGCVGFKPTYGLTSRSGVVAMASSLDCMGPITNSVDDAALVLDVMAGRDPLDSTTIDRDDVPYTQLNDELKGKIIGVVNEYMGEGLDESVRESVNSSIKALENAGAIIKQVSLPSLPLALAVYYIICPAEVSSNLSRYDGQRFGYSYPEAKNLEQSYELSREKGFGAEAKRRIMIGTYVLSSGYYDAYYRKAQTVRTKLINEFDKAFSEVDFLVGPTAPTTAFKIGENANEPLKMYLADILTVAANLVGVPAISLPTGDNVDGLPIGLQLMAPQKQDRALLSIAKTYEEISR
ncbi:MAG: Asp-tRNA(Asn)/Glu-tRNA(Gln) amidotransferase subunit GatA [bacterium]|nr:Asp-tRNA(Asn)/Glu-tRNA(Gln) amidotransferase subunit GatA [bacterium]